MKCWIWYFNFKVKPKKCFSQFLCTERQQTGLQNTQIRFGLGGLAPLDPPAGRCPCPPRGSRQPLDPGHLGSVLPQHFCQFPCLSCVCTTVGCKLWSWMHVLPQAANPDPVCVYHCRLPPWSSMCVPLQAPCSTLQACRAWCSRWCRTRRWSPTWCRLLTCNPCSRPCQPILNWLSRLVTVCTSHFQFGKFVRLFMLQVILLFHQLFACPSFSGYWSGPS